MKAYVFNNGTLLYHYNMYGLVKFGNIEVHGKTYEGTPDRSSDYVFIEADIKDIFAFHNVESPAKYELKKPSEIFYNELSVEDYEELPHDLKDLYKKKGLVTEKVGIDVEVKYYDVDYKPMPKYANFFKYPTRDEVLRRFLPCEISGKDLSQLFKHFYPGEYYDGKQDFEVTVTYNNILTVDFYNKPYGGETEKVEIRKQNGMSYATPRYRTVRARPTPIISHKVNLQNLRIEGNNAFDLSDKIEKLIKALGLPSELEEEK